MKGYITPPEYGIDVRTSKERKEIPLIIVPVEIKEIKC